VTTNDSVIIHFFQTVPGIVRILAWVFIDAILLWAVGRGCKDILTNNPGPLGYALVVICSLMMIAAMALLYIFCFNY
jgi:hypothetical protein